MAEAPPAGLPEVFVYGSCVSRDALATVPDRYRVSRYLARQSLLSVAHDASANLPPLGELEHAFQRRIVTSDWAGDLRKEIAAVQDAGHLDLLIWDLTDERHGVHWFPDGGIATRSVDVQGTSLMELLPAETRVPFASPEHREGWNAAAVEFADWLRGRGLFERTLVLRVPWAARDTAGSPVPPSAGMDADAAESAYAPYYDRLEQLGFAIADLRPQVSAAGEDAGEGVVGPGADGADAADAGATAGSTGRVLGPDAAGAEILADARHRWGPAPFHYAPGVYARIIEALDAHRATLDA